MKNTKAKRSEKKTREAKQSKKKNLGSKKKRKYFCGFLLISETKN
jgi:hypothetical protein